jgi:hypothetical protein
MKKVIRLTEQDLVKIINKVINEQQTSPTLANTASKSQRSSDTQRPSNKSMIKRNKPVVNTIAFGLPYLLWKQINDKQSTASQKFQEYCNLCKKGKGSVTTKGSQLADQIRDSVQGMGTDEAKIYQVMRQIRTVDDFCSLVKSYEASYSTPLYNDLVDDISSEQEWNQIFRPIRDVILNSQQSTGQTSTQPTSPNQSQTTGQIPRPTVPNRPQTTGQMIGQIARPA